MYWYKNNFFMYLALGASIRLLLRRTLLHSVFMATSKLRFSRPAQNKISYYIAF